MKKLFILLISISFLSPSVFAGSDPAPAECWAFPAIFEMDEEVTFYFDLSPSVFTEDDEVFWWVWQPGEPDAGNGANSSDFARCEYVGNLIWKITFVPTEYFHMTKEEILAYSEKTFWFQLKNRDGSKFTDTAKITYPEATPGSVLDGDMWAVDLTDFTILKPTTIYFNSNVASGFTPGEDVYLNSYINNAEGGDDYDFSYATAGAEKTKMEYLGDGIYRKKINPIQYFFVPGDDPDISLIDVDYELTYIKGSATNGSATSEEFNFAAASLDPGTPAVYLFPSSPMFDDIFVINRVNPTKGEEPITYTITSSGFPTITGTLTNYPNTGADKNRSVYLYLPDHWETAPTGEIRIRLSASNNTRFFDQRIRLKTTE